MFIKPSVAIAVFSLSLSPALMTRGASILIDDFDDRSDDGWTQVDLSVGAPFGPGTFDATSQAYQLRTSETVPVPAQAPAGGMLASVWNESLGHPIYSDGIVRATLRADSPDVAVGLLMRADPTSLAAYTFLGHAHFGSFEMVRNDPPGVPHVLGRIDPEPSPFAPGEDWVVEAGTVGDQISLKVWQLGAAEPADPQLIVTDSTYGHGGIGLFTRVVAPYCDDNVVPLCGPEEEIHYVDPTFVRGTFDDISFTPVPEPSPFLLALLGLFAAGMIPRHFRPGICAQVAGASDK